MKTKNRWNHHPVFFPKSTIHVRCLPMSSWTDWEATNASAKKGGSRIHWAMFDLYNHEISIEQTYATTYVYVCINYMSYTIYLYYKNHSVINISDSRRRLNHTEKWEKKLMKVMLKWCYIYACQGTSIARFAHLCSSVLLCMTQQLSQDSSMSDLKGMMVLLLMVQKSQTTNSRDV